MYKQFIKSGFTLAETLITLIIVGVIATMTIPTIMLNIQKKDTAIKLKKAYSTLANATNKAISEHGSMQSWELGTSGSGQAASDFADTYILPYVNVAKNCGTQTSGECQIQFRNLNATSYFDPGSSYTRFFLNNGTLVYININKSASDQRAVTQIDINGKKPPNTLGKDIFRFNYFIESTTTQILGKFLPSATTNSRTSILSNGTYGCNKNATGGQCAALIMKDGWLIKDDYPW